MICQPDMVNAILATAATWSNVKLNPEELSNGVEFHPKQVLFTSLYSSRKGAHVLFGVNFSVLFLIQILTLLRHWFRTPSSLLVLKKRGADIVGGTK